MLYGTMSALADIADLNAMTDCALRLCVSVILILIADGSNAEADGIPCALSWGGRTTFRITEIALVQFVLRWNLAFMTRRGPLPAPPRTERRRTGGRPCPFF